MNTENNKELSKAYDELQKKYEEAQKRLELEKRLKNEAYSFIIATGALDNYKTFRNDYITGRNDMEKIMSFLVTNAQPEGEWIEQ